MYRFVKLSHSSNAIFVRLEGSLAHLFPELGYLWWRRLPVGPFFGVLLVQRAWILVGIPMEVTIQPSSNWEPLAGEEEPGGRRSRGSIVKREEFAKREALRREGPVLKTLTWQEGGRK